VFTIKKTAELTGVPEATLRIWERRYGLGANQRSQSGYRLYDPATIDQIKAMRSLVDAGWGPAQAAQEVLTRIAEPKKHQEIGALKAHADGNELEEHVDPNIDSSEELQADFFKALANLDQESLNGVLDRAFAKSSFEFVIDNWLASTLQELGQRWLNGQSTIVMEHFASNAIMRRLGAAFESAGQFNTGAQVLVGAPLDSFHEIAILSFATSLRRRGLRAIYLGANIPAQSWADAVQLYKPRAVSISVATKEDVINVQECVDLIRSVEPSIIISVGGLCASEIQGCDLIFTGNLIQSSASLFDLLQ